MFCIILLICAPLSLPSFLLSFKIVWNNCLGSVFNQNTFLLFLLTGKVDRQSVRELEFEWADLHYQGCTPLYLSAFTSGWLWQSLDNLRSLLVVFWCPSGWPSSTSGLTVSTLQSIIGEKLEDNSTKWGYHCIFDNQNWCLTTRHFCQNLQIYQLTYFFVVVK